MRVLQNLSHPKEVTQVFILEKEQILSWSVEDQILRLWNNETFLLEKEWQLGRILKLRVQWMQQYLPQPSQQFICITSSQEQQTEQQDSRQKIAKIQIIKKNDDEIQLRQIKVREVEKITELKLFGGSKFLLLHKSGKISLNRMADLALIKYLNIMVDDEIQLEGTRLLPVYPNILILFKDFRAYFYNTLSDKILRIIEISIHPFQIAINGPILYIQTSFYKQVCKYGILPRLQILALNSQNDQNTLTLQSYKRNYLLVVYEKRLEIFKDPKTYTPLKQLTAHSFQYLRLRGGFVIKNSQCQSHKLRILVHGFDCISLQGIVQILELDI